LKEEVGLAVERLPVQCRTVFEKSRFEGKNHKEIAAEMAISVATVKHHIGVALTRLQKELGKFS
jgi:RNA polymerase sigma-70 factor (ECF subfamily)